MVPDIKTRYRQTEAGLIPEDWEVKELGLLANIVTGKLDSNQAEDGGRYPFFTCAPEPLRISSYSFDGEAMLLAGNNADGVFHTNYYKGKFDAYQRTYVITAKNNSAFLRYLLYQLGFRLNYLKEISQGTATRFLTKVILNGLKIPVPQMQEQIRIATVLSDLDLKIELNQDMNETLEAIAKAIFKCWFIDFEFPNDEGKPYKSSGGLMVESEIGRIPRNWKLETIGLVLSTRSGGTPSRDKPSYWENGTIGWINSGKVRDFRITEPVELITQEALENSATTLIPRDTTVIAITGATLGEVSFMEIESCISQNVVAILGTNHIASEFIYFWIKHMMADLISWQTGGAQQHINKKIVDDSLLLEPDSETMGKFTAVIRPIFERISASCFEAVSLTRLRDTLIPKLMSGQIRIPVEVR